MKKKNEPRTLSGEEKLLLDYIRKHPVEATLIANVTDDNGYGMVDTFLFTLFKNRGEFETACAVVTLYNQMKGTVPVLRTLLQEEHTQVSLGELLDYVKNDVALGGWSDDIRQVADTMGHEDDTVSDDVELRTLMAAEYLTLLQKVVKTGEKNG